MGKNQAYKAMQKARLGSSSAGPDEMEDGMIDGSFHSPEWHAARLASLKTSHTITWEEYKKKQKNLGSIFCSHVLGRLINRASLFLSREHKMSKENLSFDQRSNKTSSSPSCLLALSSRKKKLQEEEEEDERFDFQQSMLLLQPIEDSSVPLFPNSKQKENGIHLPPRQMEYIFLQGKWNILEHFHEGAI